MVEKALRADVIYQEIQQFRQTWLWITLLPASLLPAALFGYGIHKQLVLDVPWGNKPMPDCELLIVGSLMFLIAIGLPFLFYITKLITVVDREGIYIRYFPFLQKTIPFKNLNNYRVRTYDAISWGIQWNKNGWAYTVSGDWGVELELANGRQLLIGSQQPEMLVQAIETGIKQQQGRKGKGK